MINDAEIILLRVHAFFIGVLEKRDEDREWKQRGLRFGIGVGNFFQAFKKCLKFKKVLALEKKNFQQMERVQKS